MSNTVHVSGIASQTSEKEVQDFFSFCGKIQTITVTPESADASAAKTAVVTFEKETAAKTALLLDNTQLGPAQVKVTSATNAPASGAVGGTTSSSTSTGASATHSGEETSDNIAQEDKPRSRIVAEYLAHGYVISDKAIERAIQLDNQHGMSHRFLSALQGFDSKYGVSEKTAQVDQKYGVSKTAQQGWLGLASYFDKAASTPTGQKVRAFYEQGSKQVLDVHNEAKHLASLKMGKPESAVLNPSSSEKGVPSAEEAELEKVQIDGKERTKCNCGGADGKCPCEPGKCACSGCSKAS